MATDWFDRNPDLAELVRISRAWDGFPGGMRLRAQGNYLEFVGSISDITPERVFATITGSAAGFNISCQVLKSHGGGIEAAGMLPTGP